jgi:gamma-glutamyl:cysteine ligase YbdK (ATP-grasp superfamily)
VAPYSLGASLGRAPDILFDGEEPEPARQVGRRVLDAVLPYARELGAGDALEEIERILREGNGADEQRRVCRERGMSGLLEHLTVRR